MRQHRIFVEQPLREGIQVELHAAAARHVQQVLRLKPGQHISVFDGRGGEYDAQIAGARKQVVSVEVHSFRAVDVESPLRIHLGQGLARGDRMDQAIQKAVELGVGEVTPLGTERSVIKLKAERVGRRLEHWQSVAVHAAEQCGRTQVPTVHAPVELDRWLETVQADLKVFMEPTATNALIDISPSGSGVALLIGPEGGLTESELASASRAKFAGVRMGPRVLRTETATVVGLTALQTAWGDFR